MSAVDPKVLSDGADHELLFVPLGGTGEIGMNNYLYGYGPVEEHQWLMVDCGLTFADDRMPGVDLILPNLGFIAERRERLAGLVLTHAHEDHVGAVPYLWERLRCPVYATPFTAEFLRRKLEETGLAGRVPLHEVALGGRVSAGPFDVEFITMTHSIPEPNALAIRTPVGTVIHSGDWKLDPKPVIGATTDEDRLRQIGDEGVLAFTCDSTNVFTPGRTKSEGDLLDSLTDLFGRYEKRIAVTCFASNVARLRTIAKAAAAHGRDAVLVGRSLRRIDSVARATGYLDDLPPFVPEEDAGYLPEDRTVIIITGSQGEPRAALSRVANGDHPNVTLESGDVVVFSSRIIPGNERAIGRLHNALIARGVEVVTDKSHFVHVSGHPARDEMVRLYELVRPRIAVPMHGEIRHLHEHARLARTCGVPEVLVPEDGSVLRLGPAPAEAVDAVPVGRLTFEGNRLVKLDGDIQKERRRVLYNGSAVATLVVDAEGRLVAEPQLATQGLLEAEGDEDLADAVIARLADAVRSLPRRERRNDDAMREAARLAVRRTFRDTLGKKPVTEIHLVRI